MLQVDHVDVALDVHLVVDAGDELLDVVDGLVGGHDDDRVGALVGHDLADVALGADLVAAGARGCDLLLLVLLAAVALGGAAGRLPLLGRGAGRVRLVHAEHGLDLLDRLGGVRPLELDHLDLLHRGRHVQQPQQLLDPPDVVGRVGDDQRVGGGVGGDVAAVADHLAGDLGQLLGRRVLQLEDAGDHVGRIGEVAVLVGLDRFFDRLPLGHDPDDLALLDRGEAGGVHGGQEGLVGLADGHRGRGDDRHLAVELVGDDEVPPGDLGEVLDHVLQIGVDEVDVDLGVPRRTHRLLAAGGAGRGPLAIAPADDRLVLAGEALVRGVVLAVLVVGVLLLGLPLALVVGLLGHGPLGVTPSLDGRAARIEQHLGRLGLGRRVLRLALVPFLVAVVLFLGGRSQRRRRGAQQQRQGQKQRI